MDNSMLIRVAFFYLTLLLIIPGSLSVPGCEKGWHRSHGRCYRATRRVMTRDEAMRICSRQGASLVSLNDANERDSLISWLHRTAKRFDSANYGLTFFWTGGKFDASSQWVWGDSNGNIEPISSEVWSGSGSALLPGEYSFLGLYVPQFNPTAIGLINSNSESRSHVLCEKAAGRRSR